LAWAKLPQLDEVVSLDTSLCPVVIRDLSPDDWAHNVAEDFRTEFFTDLDYLMRRVGDRSGVNVLAVIFEPDNKDLNAFQDERFQFIGFDLVERPGKGISAMVNCGGFDKAFRPEDLNRYGLISDYRFAGKVQQRLATFYPEENHADCALWAIWRMEI
jgi:hypothetical protein